LLKWQTGGGIPCHGLICSSYVWQYTHGFPSVRYHLIERNATNYQSGFTVEYITGQILLAGPLIGWLLLWAAFAYKPADLFEKALKWSLVGIYGLFFVATFKGRSEANWTVPAFVGLIVLANKYLQESGCLSGLAGFIPAMIVISLPGFT
jgi:hypothetical protein